MSPDQEFSQVLQEWAEVFMHRSMRDFKQFMADSGLSASQLNAMMRLYHGGECEISEIAEHLDVTLAATSQLVERLVQQGLVERVESPHDRRVKLLRLTSQGQVLIQRGIEARRCWMEELTYALSPQEQEEIKRGLKLLTQAARCLEKAQVPSESRASRRPC